MSLHYEKIEWLLFYFKEKKREKEGHKIRKGLNYKMLKK